MLFNSIEFLIFFTVFFVIYLGVKDRVQLRWLLLTMASFFFYGWWSFKYLWLLVATGVFDFSFAILIYKSKNQHLRKLYLGVSLLFNLGTLFSFKYSKLIFETVFSALSYFGLSAASTWQPPSAFSVLPIGISFYTFESLSYVFDVYRGHLKPAKNVLHYFSFLSMFPRLIAGPIERPSNLLPQLSQKIEFDDDNMFDGLRLVCLGYFKKTVVADNLAVIVNSAFANGAHLSTPYWWYVMICFSFQIYFDFSGYTDIARGLAQLLGYRFNQNFNHPYVSASFKEFWSRWHISLSTWFRDYVYIPLGGDRKGTLRTHVNLWITMVASGLWHGASWTFAVWGALHAFYSSLERVTAWPERIARLPGGRWAARGIVFVAALVAWVFFRAASFDQAFAVLHKLVAFEPGDTGQKSVMLIAFAVGYEWVWHHSKGALGRLTPSWQTNFNYALIVISALSSTALRGPSEQFIYFQF